MRNHSSSGAFGIGGLAVVLAVMMACGSDESPASGSEDAGADGPPAGPPTPSPFGLDARPSNATCLAGPRPTTATAIKLTPVFPSLTFDSPVLLLQAPGDTSKWYVVEQGEGGVRDARVRVFANDPAVTDAADFVRIPAAELMSGPPSNEGGLLGFAFHPGWATNGTAFLSYTVHSATSPVDMKAVVTRLKRSATGSTLDRATEAILTGPGGAPLAIDKPTVLHNNAHMTFGPDGLLYVGMGDGGEPSGIKGQDATTIFGKILRIDAAAEGAYAVPPSNPWAGISGRVAETWAYGLRNPWRFSFDRTSGDLWAGDVGDDAYEEIDKIQKGGNYGWGIAEGNHCNDDGACNLAGLAAPVVEYPHANGNYAVVGGYVYRGANIPGLYGSYLFADYVSGRIWRIAPGANVADELLASGFPISSFGEGPDGELYVLDFQAGRILRVDPDAPGGGGNLAQALSATGCVDPNIPKNVAPGLIPYDVNVPLWSDGADKRRWLALPDGASITVGPDGDFDLPNGAVIVKEFSLAGRRIETRLLMRHDDGVWAGYTYEWNDAETDAALLPSAKMKPIGAQVWSFPGRTECAQCHTAAAGRSLGLEIGQLNGDFVYASTNRLSNQLATLEHIGVFAVGVGDPGGLARYPKLGSNDAVDLRARAYIHTNCSNCHREAGGTQANMDLRYGVSFADMRICAVTPVIADLGIDGAKLLAPGDPSKSILSLRMHASDTARMPPLARSVLDTEGGSVIDAWISSVQSCP